MSFSVKALILLVFGLILGICFSKLKHMASQMPIFFSVGASGGKTARISFEKSLSNFQATENILNNLVDSDRMTSLVSMLHNNSKADISPAARLFNETRLLCLVLTTPDNHKTKAIHIKKTWGSRCNKLLLISSAKDEKLGTIKLSVGEGRKNLWVKTREAFKYVWDQHRNEADWFLKADDDTYVIPENLRAFLYPFSTNSPVYFGCKFKSLVKQGYMLGGAGYVLSRDALRRFVEVAYPNAALCSQHQVSREDVEMGKCLQNVGVVAGDSRDEKKRERFFPSGPLALPSDRSHWYWKYIFYPTNNDTMPFSDQAISFHYLPTKLFYVIDYLVYHLRPFGVSSKPDALLFKTRDMKGLINKWRNETSNTF